MDRPRPRRYHVHRCEDFRDDFEVIHAAIQEMPVSTFVRQKKGDRLMNQIHYSMHLAAGKSEGPSGGTFPHRDRMVRRALCGMSYAIAIILSVVATGCGQPARVAVPPELLTAIQSHCPPGAIFLTNARDPIKSLGDVGAHGLFVVNISLVDLYLRNLVHWPQS